MFADAMQFGTPFFGYFAGSVQLTGINNDGFKIPVVLTLKRVEQTGQMFFLVIRSDDDGRFGHQADGPSGFKTPNMASRVR